MKSQNTINVGLDENLLKDFRLAVIQRHGRQCGYFKEEVNHAYKRQIRAIT